MSSSSAAFVLAAPPADLNRFIGRRRELEEGGQLLRATRLLTLTGAGGSGKTRLASAMAQAASGAYPAGVAWVDLAALSDPAAVPLHVATTLRLPEQPGRLPTDTLRLALLSREALLVLDGCEHLVVATAELVDLLLRGCPRLTILTTSREALGVPGERAWLVPPMSVEGGGDAGSEAMELFLERAREVLPEFSLTAENSAAVREICTRLDGIPLAIELAAARTRVLTPSQIADRLEDAFQLLTAGSRTALPRHKTLRRAVDWSYDLLPPREQNLLCRLGVFGGPFTLAAVEEVCSDDDLPAGEILDSLAALVDKSLLSLDLRDGDGRYHLLDTMRQYAVDRLRAAQTWDTWRSRLTAWALGLVEAAAPRIFGGASDANWLRRLDAETESIRAALDWAEEDPTRAEIALRFAAALHWYWFARGRFREGRQRLERALADAPDVAPLIRGMALIARGHVQLWQAEPVDVTALREAVMLVRPAAREFETAYALTSLGAALCASGEVDEAVGVLREALDLVCRLPDQVLSSFTRYWLGVTLLARDDLATARVILEAALEIGWRLGNGPSIAHPLTILGKVQWAAGDLDYALAAFREALAIHAEGQDTWGIAQAIEGVARIRLARGDSARGLCLMSGAAAIRDRYGVPMPPGERVDVEEGLAEVATTMAPATFTAAWARGQRLNEADLIRLALEADIEDSPMAITAELPVPKPVVTDRATLDVTTLGTLEVRCNGTLIPSDRWGSARARDLLVLLLLHRHGLTKEEVGLVFWPDASAAQVRNSFHVTLHRLRKALSRADWVVSDAERYRLKPGLAVRCDAEQFEQAILLALRSAERRQDRAAEELADALSLYRGPFLAGTQTGDWALDTRDRLQVLATRGWLLVARLREQQGDPAGTGEAFRQLLELDGLHEEACRGLMRVLTRQGERAQALRLCARLAERLDRELQLSPDPQTILLQEQIQKGEVV